MIKAEAKVKCVHCSPGQKVIAPSISECMAITSNNGFSVRNFVIFRMMYRIEAAPAVNPAMNKDETTPMCK